MARVRTSAILTCTWCSTWLSSTLGGAEAAVGTGAGGTASPSSSVCELVRLRGVSPRRRLAVPFLKELENVRSSVRCLPSWPCAAGQALRHRERWSVAKAALHSTQIYRWAIFLQRPIEQLAHLSSASPTLASPCVPSCSVSGKVPMKPKSPQSCDKTPEAALYSNAQRYQVKQVLDVAMRRHSEEVLKYKCKWGRRRLWKVRHLLQARVV